jgi:glycosyltransferase involved in cell wall biosynthesis
MWIKLFGAREPSRPAFSVIIPSFRCAGKLARSIASILEQSRELFEIVVVDGDSKDETMDVLKSNAAQIRWISEPDAGIYDAMNKGIALSQGRYLYFLGAGDTLRGGILAKLAPQMPSRAIGFVYGNVFMHDRGVVWDGPWTAQKFRTRTPCQQAIFYDRRVFERHGGFDPQFRAMADYAMNIRCFGDPKIKKIFIDEIIADYEGGGFSASYRDEAFYAARPTLLREHLGLVVEPKN